MIKTNLGQNKNIKLKKTKTLMIKTNRGLKNISFKICKKYVHFLNKVYKNKKSKKNL